MERNQLVAGLRRHAFTEPALIRGQYLALFLADFFEGLELTEEELGGPSYGSNIPQLLVGALEEFRTSDDPAIRELRVQHQEDTGRPFPDLTAPQGKILPIDRAISELAGIFTEASGEDWVGHEIVQVFRSPINVIELEFYWFLRRVYSQGLEQIIRVQRAQQRSALFGQTTLSCFKDRRQNYVGISFGLQDECIGGSTYFAPLSSESGALDWGLRDLSVDTSLALSMIADVVEHWPTEPFEQLESFKLQQQTGLF